MRRPLTLSALWLFSAALAAAPSPRPFSLDDLARVRDVSDPDLAPDGSRVAYAVRTTDTRKTSTRRTSG